MKLKHYILCLISISSICYGIYAFWSMVLNCQAPFYIECVGAKLDKHLEGIIIEMNILQTMHHQPFYWNKNTNLDCYRSNDIEKRNMEDIAPEEILVALHEVVKNNLSIEEDELLRYLARTFNFAKVGNQIDTILRYVIDMAVEQGKVKSENKRIKLGDK